MGTRSLHKPESTVPPPDPSERLKTPEPQHNVVSLPATKRTQMLNALYLMDARHFDHVYGPDERRDLEKLVHFCAPLIDGKNVFANPGALAQAEVILSSWGMPKMDETFLAAAPKLKAVFYAAVTVKGFVTDASWARGIVVSSGYAGNAVPVAEFCLGMILLSLKQVWYNAVAIKQQGAWPARRSPAGAYGSTIGLISLGMVGRRVGERLRPFDLRVIACDPFVSAADAKALGVTLVPLDEIFRAADVVSLHTPSLPETRGMITGAHIASMKPGATFLNTARGAVVRETEMIEVLQRRPDLTAILDVTDPEPPLPGSPLYTLPNVVLTPHIAGSQDYECRRMGRYMVEELQRYIAGQPLRWQITQEQVAKLA